MKGIILFDIDRTIFDTDRMSRIFDEKILEILGTNDSGKFEKVKEDYKRSLKFDRDFRVEEYIKVMRKAFGFAKQDKLEEIFFGPKFAYIYKDSVYPETYKILDRLVVNYRLGIFSEGELKFQNHKLRSMGLGEYFDADLIFIVLAKDNQETLEKIPEDATVVDDKERMCEFLDRNGLRAVWLNKKDKRINQNFETIHDLLDLNL